jgi:DNA-binding transcriptional LysR family regulator
MARVGDAWLGIQLRHLAALQAVALYRSFGQAAAQLGITQSAVSQQIAALERIVGQRLVERKGGSHSVSLTEAGRLLLVHAEAITARFQTAKSELWTLAKGIRALRIGTFPSVGARVLPWLIRDFAVAWPGVEVRMSESPNDAKLLLNVERGALELTFAQMPVDETVFEVVELFRDPYVLLVPSGSELASGGTPTFDQIARLRLIGYTHCRTLHHIESQVRSRGLEPQILYRSDNCGTIQGLVASGVASALMPRLVTEPLEPGVTMLDLDADVPPRIIGLVWRRHDALTPPAEAFVQIALHVCRDRWQPAQITLDQTAV